MSIARDHERLAPEAAGPKTLVDEAESRSAQTLRAEARRCRRIALSVDPQTAAQLERFGLDLDKEARRADVL